MYYANCCYGITHTILIYNLVIPSTLLHTISLVKILLPWRQSTLCHYCNVYFMEITSYKDITVVTTTHNDDIHFA